MSSAASVPPHKVIPGTGGAIVVDAFRFAHPGVKAYFLTHAHSDHYTGLTENWSGGPVYCSPVTARLVAHLCGVDPSWLRPLQMGVVHSVAGVEVTLVDANHCPGAVQLLFRLPASGARYLHCGDMRFCAAMTSCPLLAAWRGCDAVFLDTTYCHPKHTFPLQEDSVDFVARTLEAYLEEDKQAQQRQGQGQEATGQGQDGGAPGTGDQATGAQAVGNTCPLDSLTATAVAATAAESEEELTAGAMVCDAMEGGGGDGDGGAAAAGQGAQEAADGAAYGAEAAEDGAGPEIGSGGSGGPFPRIYLISTYVIGKERILLAIRQRCGVPVYVSETKMAVLSLLGYSEDQLRDTFTTDPRATPVHVVGWGTLGETWPFFRPNFVNMQRTAEEMGAPAVVGFCPTGWLYEMRRTAFPVRTRGSLSVHLVPYSEHSSYSELREYVKWLRPQQVIPTVGVGGDDGERNRAAMLKHFRTLVDETASKAKFLAGMRGRAAGQQPPKQPLQQQPQQQPQLETAGAGEPTSGAAPRDQDVEAEPGVAAAGVDGPRPTGAQGADVVPKGRPLRRASRAAPVEAQRGQDKGPEEPSGNGKGRGRGGAAVGRVAGGSRASSRQPAGTGSGSRGGLGGDERGEGANEAEAGGVIVIDSSSSSSDDDDEGGTKGNGGYDVVERGEGKDASAAGVDARTKEEAAGVVPPAEAEAVAAAEACGTRDFGAVQQGSGSALDAAPESIPQSDGEGDDETDPPSGTAGAVRTRPSYPGLQQLLAVLGADVSPADGERLLAATRGDVAAAVNLFFDGGLSRLPAGPAGGTAGGAPGAAGGAAAGRGKAASGGGTASGARTGTGSGAPGQPRNARSSQGGGGGGGSGGAAGAAQSGSARAAKRPRLSAAHPAVLPPGGGVAGGGGGGGACAGGQRSISSFFAARGRGPTEPPATAKAAAGTSAAAVDGMKAPAVVGQGSGKSVGGANRLAPGSNVGVGRAAGSASDDVNTSGDGRHGGVPGRPEAANGTHPGQGPPLSSPVKTEPGVAMKREQDAPGASNPGSLDPPSAILPATAPVSTAIASGRGTDPAELTSAAPVHHPLPARRRRGQDGASVAPQATPPPPPRSTPPVVQPPELLDGPDAGLGSGTSDGGGNSSGQEDGGNVVVPSTASPTRTPSPSPIAKRPRLGGGLLLPKYSPTAAAAPAAAVAEPTLPRLAVDGLEEVTVPAAAAPSSLRTASQVNGAETRVPTAAAAAEPPSSPVAATDEEAAPPAASCGGRALLEPHVTLHPFFAGARAGGAGAGPGAGAGCRGRKTPSKASPAGRGRGRDRGVTDRDKARDASKGRGKGSAAASGGQDRSGAAEAAPATRTGEGADNAGDDADAEPVVDLVSSPETSRQGLQRPAPPPLPALPRPATAAATTAAGKPTVKQEETSGAAAVTAVPAASSARGGAAAASNAAISWEHARNAVLLPPAKYDPVRHACWGPAAGPTPYLHVALSLAAIDSTTKRLLIADALTNMFRSVLALAEAPAADLVAVLYLVTGRIAPEYDKMELSVGGATVSGALMAATGTSAARMKQLYRQMGDLGDVAQACRRTQSTLRSPQPLLVGRLLRQLRAIAADKGSGVAGRRQAAVLGMLRACRDCEVKYLTRTLISNLRVGANWRSVLGPLGRAVLMHQRATAATAAAGTAGAGAGAGAGGQHPPTVSGALPAKAELEAAAAAVVEAYHLCPNFDLLVPALLEGGPEGLRNRCVLTPGVPIKPMLAKICEGVADGLRQIGLGAPFLAEYKYDGVRAQIHLLPGGQVFIFSRNCEDRTDSYPDVCALIRAAAANTAAPDPKAAIPLAVAAAGPAAPASAMTTGPLSLAAAEPGTSVSGPVAAAGDGGSGGAGGGSISNIVAAGGTSSCVLDAEVVAVEWLGGEDAAEAEVEAADGAAVASAAPYRLRAFQELATRARGQVEQHQVTVQVCVFVFDLLYWNGTPLLQRPLRERRTLLRTALPGMSPGRVMLASALEMEPLMPPAAGRAVAHPGPHQQQQQQQPHRRRGAGTSAAAAADAGATGGPADEEEGDAVAAAAAAAPVRLWPAPGEEGARGRPEEAGPATAAWEGSEEGSKGAVSRAVVRGRTASATERDGRAAADLVDLADEEEREHMEEAEAVAKRDAKSPATGAATGGGAVAACARGDALDGAATKAVDVEVEVEGPTGTVVLEPAPGGSASEAVYDMLLQAFNSGAEGLMLKRLDGSAAYEPSRRSEAWIKVKRDYCEGLRDSVDVVPIGAWYGQGRKVKWFSPFLLAVYDPVSEQFQSLCRCMSGFTDEFYAAATERLGATVIPGPKPYYNTGERPSVWFEPTEVWELRGADLTLSPVHRAAAGRLHPERGVGMRFPRFIRIRDDKRIEDATTPDDITDLYNRQTRKVVPANGNHNQQNGGNNVSRRPPPSGPSRGAGQGGSDRSGAGPGSKRSRGGKGDVGGGGGRASGDDEGSDQGRSDGDGEGHGGNLSSEEGSGDARGEGDEEREFL